MRWLRATSQKLEDVLTELHDKHCILPGAVLYMIAEEWHYIHQFKNRSQDEIDRLAPLEKTLSDNRGREIKKSLKILKAAILEIEKWKPMIWSLYNVDWSKLAVTARFYSDINSQMMIEELNHLEHNVRQLNRTKPGRPQLTRLRKCARNLAAFFRQFIEGRPCHEYTATILAKSFPAVAQWCSHDNIRKLIDRGPPDLPGPNLIRDYAFALQRRDPEYTEHFRQLDDQFQTARKDPERQQKLIQKRQHLIEKELKAPTRNGHKKKKTPTPLLSV